MYVVVDTFFVLFQKWYLFTYTFKERIDDTVPYSIQNIIIIVVSSKHGRLCCIILLHTRKKKKGDFRIDSTAMKTKTFQYTTHFVPSCVIRTLQYHTLRSLYRTNK